MPFSCIAIIETDVVRWRSCTENPKYNFKQTMELKYSDEQDQCYGVTGMAVSLVIWDADDMLARIDLDADDNIEFVPEYYFAGNPRLSAKVAWQYILKHYQASMGMMIGNVMCRNYMQHNTTPDSHTRTALLECLEEEGADTCSLETDEIHRLFDRSYSYLDRVFAHSGVQKVVRDFARELQAHRSLSRGDVAEMLADLRNL